MVKVGIIGGSGVYDPEILQDTKQIKVHTPFGATSDLVTVGTLKGVEVVFLPRHGHGHKINPTNVPFRANIWAMKQLGVTHIFAPSAVGSLREEVKPGDLVFTDQFIDRTIHRKNSFFEGNQVCHISIADPCCNNLKRLLVDSANSLGITFHEQGTCVVVEGPRFSTRAESNVFRSWGADIIGMTMCPEAILAREAEICYQTIAMVTDYDVWKVENEVTLEEVLKRMKDNVKNVKRLLEVAIPKVKDEDCACRHALQGALI
ncbi:MAG: S-methyl-5'-thioadenosine phosphorylase [Nanoarchaeota archaeon]